MKKIVLLSIWTFLAIRATLWTVGQDLSFWENLAWAFSAVAAYFFAYLNIIEIIKEEKGTDASKQDSAE